MQAYTRTYAPWHTRTHTRNASLRYSIRLRAACGHCVDPAAWSPTEGLHAALCDGLPERVATANAWEAGTLVTELRSQGGAGYRSNHVVIVLLSHCERAMPGVPEAEDHLRSGHARAQESLVPSSSIG